jgi:hypothetical protein
MKVGDCEYLQTKAVAEVSRGDTLEGHLRVHGQDLVTGLEERSRAYFLHFLSWVTWEMVIY